MMEVMAPRIDLEGQSHCPDDELIHFYDDDPNVAFCGLDISAMTEDLRDGPYCIVCYEMSEEGEEL